jgi:hypothetical protein
MDDVSIREFEEQVRVAEGIRIIIRADSSLKVLSYRTDGNRAIQDWTGKRFLDDKIRPCIGNLPVEIVDLYNEPIVLSTHLNKIREKC